MAKKPKLRVFRTAIGFHDAYVAASSQKAALEAWGATRNLFASGAAEPVTDPKLMAASMAKPGEVLKVLRGTRAEQLAALGKADPVHAIERKTAAKPVAVKARNGLRPSRVKLDTAEAAITELQTRHRSEQEQLRKEERALESKRAALQTAHTRKMAIAARKRDKAGSAYERALAKWKGD